MAQPDAALQLETENWKLESKQEAEIQLSNLLSSFQFSVSSY